MASSLPSFLVVEIRHVFRQCALQNSRSTLRHFNCGRLRQFQASYQQSLPRARVVPSSDSQQAQPQTKHSSETATEVGSIKSSSPKHSQQSRELIPHGRDGSAVGARRTVDAPIKIIPKADVTPNLRLTPKERLHIEILTRRAPPVIKQIKPYKERLLIYHHGNLRENASIFLKVLGLVCAGVVTCIIVPAHYTAGSPLWLCGSLLLAGWFPSLFFHNLLKPNVTRVHLRLPPNARVSPDTAMKYAKNLPVSAQIDVSFTRITALPGTVTVNLADLQPISKASRWTWRHANVRWAGQHVDKGSWFRPNPTEFFVAPEIGPGRAKRDVIPGIWSEVYSRLVGMTKEPVSRWKKL